MAAILAIVLAIAPFDSRSILGLNPWIKPIKFLVSITIYLWTMGWLLSYLREAKAAVRWISRGVATAMVVEIICITLQAARGTTSHFNNSTPWDAAIFSVMGAFIAVNSALAAWALLLFFTRSTGLAPAHIWGVRLGLVIFLLGSAEGGVMVSNNAHTVGTPDGGPGLPFVNWSTAAGDLRAAHALGLHALQILPIAGWLISRRFGPKGLQVIAICAFGVMYSGAMAWLFHQALSGRPFVPG
jgi:hypothetical protein